MKTWKKRIDAGKSRDRYRRRAFALPGQLQLDLTDPKDREQVKQDVAKVVKQPTKTAGAVLQRTFLTKDKGVRGLLKNVRQTIKENLKFSSILNFNKLLNIFFTSSQK